MEKNTTGAKNVAVGLQALEENTTADGNTAVGHACLSENTTGYNNTAMGHLCADACTTGIDNTAIGEQTASNLTTGNRNTCIGKAAGYELTDGDNNLLLGDDAGRSNSPSGNITTGSNKVVLGDNNISNLYCADTSISSSDSRDKTDITDFTKGLDWIKALRPVTYRWDRRTWYGTDEEPYGTPDGSKKTNRLHVGFLGQEALAVEEANGYGNDNNDSLILNLTDDGMSYGMKYERLVPVLVNAVKELSAENTALKARLDAAGL